MSKIVKAQAFLEKALAEWRKQETLKKGKTSVSKFADFLNYSQTAVSLWLNGDRNISEEALMEILPKLAELLGMEIYDELEIQRPNLLYQYVARHWKNLPPEEQKRVGKTISKYTDDPLPNDTEAQPTTKS
jgi:transcriptional regulator with XRE-family HTH domain